jgi:hypothetical protein
MSVLENGGDLVALPGTPPHRPRGPRLAPRAAGPGTPDAPPGFLSDEMKAQAQPFAEEIWQKLLDLASGHVPDPGEDGMPDPPGEQMFPRESDDAADWDRYRRRGLRVPERVWLLGAMRAREAAARGRQAGTG